MKRTIAIGDIHGCAVALEELLRRIAPTPDDTIITLGDYVDRGPDSRRVIELLLDLRSRTTLISLLGNHEIMMLSAREEENTAPFWLFCGGRETLASYGGSLTRVPESHWQFLMACEFVHETEQFFFVHANYDPQRALADQDEHVMCWQHLNDPLTPPHASGKIAVVGHTPQPSGLPLLKPHLYCLDTYCFGGGWLTACEVATQTLWQANEEGKGRG